MALSTSPPTLFSGPAQQTLGLRRRAPLLQPGWPLTMVLVGYPLWWVLGVAQVIALAAGVVMAVQLWRMGGLRVQRGFGMWLLFLAWVLVGVLVLQVDAPGAIPGASATRYITFGFRLGWYLTATVTLLYVYNMRDRLSTTRIMRAFGWLFVTVTAGGVLGSVFPRLDFPSVIELVLPPGVTNIQFVHDTVHPVIAQLYTVEGALNPRTSAPFPYTNQWGLNLACLLPFFIAGWLGSDAGWRRRVAPVVLLVSGYTIIESQNRGLWLALAMMAVVLAIRAAVLGHLRLLGGIFAAAVALAGVVFVTPLGQPILDRLVTATSNGGRASLGQLSVDSVLAGSPVVGFGTTRNLEGSFYSIAGGNTASCGLCTPPALGTQGHLWLLIYSTGVGGLVLYLAFILLNLYRGVRQRSHGGPTGALVVTAHIATMLVYDSISIALVSIFAGIGLIWRGMSTDQTPSPDRPGEPTIGGYSRLLRANAGVIVLLVVLGAAGGIVFREMRGLQATATNTVLVPQASEQLNAADRRAQTLDSIAPYARSPRVLAAVSRITGRQIRPDDTAISVTATPNTRLLQIHVTDRIPGVAIAAAAEAAKALVAERADVLRTERDIQIADLTAQQRSLVTAITSLEAAADGDPTLAARLSTLREPLLASENVIAARLARLRGARVSGGTIVNGSRAYIDSGLWLDSVAGGVMIGLTLALCIAMIRHARSRYVGNLGVDSTIGSVPVLARIADTSRRPGKGLLRTREPLSHYGYTAALAASDHEPVLEAARYIDIRADSRLDGQQVVLVAGPRTRVRDIENLRTRVEQNSASVRGLVLVEQRCVAGGAAVIADLRLTSSEQV